MSFLTVSRHGYGADLAYIHDSGFTGYLDTAAAGLIGLIRQTHRMHGRVVDLGCGSGRWARLLTDAGYNVLGVDSSSSMIRLARAHAPRAEFRRASLFRTPLPRCVAVTALGECLNYAFDPASGWRGVAGLFARVYDALLPGGCFIFDALGPGLVPAGMRRTSHSQREGWIVIAESSEDPRRRVLTRRITCFRKVGRLYRRLEEVHRLRLYPAAALRRSLRGTGFRVRQLRSYGALQLLPNRASFCATKPDRTAHTV